jgi:hypothetical protein
LHGAGFGIVVVLVLVLDKILISSEYEDKDENQLQVVRLLATCRWSPSFALRAREGRLVTRQWLLVTGLWQY